MRLIDADALVTAYDAAHDGPPGKARALILNAPTVDAVPVVRCKDCKWWNTEWKHEDGECYCYKIDQWTAPQFFCADGERRGKDALD